MNLSQFSLLKEDDNSYTVGHPKGKSITVPKQGMSEKAHALVKKLKKPQYAEDGGPQEPEEAPEENGASDYVNQLAQEQNAAPAAPADANASPGVSSSQEGAAPAEQPAPVSTPPAAGVSASLAEEKRTIQAGVAAQRAAGKESAEALGDAQEAIDDLPTANKLTEDYNKQGDQYRQAIEDGHIDPNRVYHNMGTGAKIATGIAMFLGGIGSGITGGPNPAAQFLKETVDRDIAAQENDQTKNMNLFKMNREALGNALAARAMTQNQLMTGVEVALKKAAATAQGPLAAQQAAQGIQMIESGIAQNNWMLGKMKGSDTPIEQLIPMMMQGRPPAEQSKALQEASMAKLAWTRQDEIMENVHQAMKDYAAGPTLGRVGTESPAVQRIRVLMDPFLKDELGRPNPAAVEHMNEILPHFWEKEKTTQDNAKLIQQMLDQKKQTPTLDANFIPTQSLRRGIAGGKPLNGGGYKPGDIVNVNGKKYKVGPDGDILTGI